MAESETLTFETSSFLPDVSLNEVWRIIGSWDGVNQELGPILKMSVPARYAKIDDIPADGKSHFSSCIKLFGIIPIDRHKFSFVEIKAPHYFDERSSHLYTTLWSHRRTLVERSNGVEVTDKCGFTPRLKFMGGLLRVIYISIFKRRHQRLLKNFSKA